MQDRDFFQPGSRISDATTKRKRGRKLVTWYLNFALKQKNPKILYWIWNTAVKKHVISDPDPDQDPSARGMDPDPDPDPSINKQKK